MVTLRVAFLNFSNDLSSLNDLSKLFHSFEAKFVEVQRHQFLFQKALRTLSFLSVGQKVKPSPPPPALGDFCRHVSFQSFTQRYLVGVPMQQHSFPQQRVTGYPHKEVS